MREMTRWLAVLGAGAVLNVAVPAAAADQAQDRTQDQDRLRTRDRLKDALQTDGKLSTSEIQSVEPDLDGIAKRGGNEEQFRAMIRSSLGDGCKGACLCEAVRSMNQFMQRGQSGEQARNTVQTMLRAQAQERERQKLALSDEQNQQRLRERTREREKELDRERTREQSRERAQSGQGPAGAGSQGGKGK
jgi:hypothetical protein